MEASEYWERIQALFFQALDLDEDDRPAYLEAECGNDEAIRAEVEAMLSAHERSHGLLLENRLLADEDPVWHGPEALLGKQVGVYRLKSLIGEGGMGAVYLAERNDGQYTQTVALKIVQPGLRTSEIISRFRLERQILARLQHPNISRLLDGGVTDDGLPFLVMEYVEGMPLIAYCDEHKMRIDQRLKLFKTVCETVQFAHRNLIVHRDLKPTNILVTAEGQVKLLDFGIAKLLDAGGQHSQAKTRADLRIMTPEYAAPEQIRGEAITTTTDVYALGVLLYELLTGHRPYRLPKRWQAQVERIICEEEPTRPSTVIEEVEEVPAADGSTLTLTPERVTAARNTVPGRLRRVLQGDLDNIVMMALRKEPERRYASAQQVVEDIDRYLNGRPVIARKDTVSYRVQKFIRRNGVGVSVAAGVLLLLIGFTVLSSIQAKRIASERDKSEHVSAFLSSLFAAADPTVARGDTLTAIELLDRGAARIESELADQPEVQLQLLDVIGNAYLNQGAAVEAEAVTRRALALQTDDESREALQTVVLLADALQAQSRYPEADSLHRLVVSVGRRTGDSAELVEALERRGQFLISSLGRPDTIKAVFEEALALRREVYGTADPGRGRTLLLYAGAHHVSGEYDIAVNLFREALNVQRHFPGDPATSIETMSQLGFILNRRRQHTEADSLFREALDLSEQTYGRVHPVTARLLVSLADNLNGLRAFDEAEASLREAIDLYTQLGEREGNGYRSALMTLRLVYTDSEKYDQAIFIAREVVELTEAIYGDEHRSYGTNLGLYAQVLYLAGEVEASLDVYQQALPLLERTFGREHAFTAMMIAETARSLHALERTDEALSLYGEAYDITEKKLGRDSFLRSRIAFEYGTILLGRGNIDRALPLFQDAAEVRIAESTGAAKMNARALFEVGRILSRLGRPDEARPYLEEAAGKLSDVLGEHDEETRAAQEAVEKL